MTNNTQKSATECREAFERKLYPDARKRAPNDNFYADEKVQEKWQTFQMGYESAHADTMRLVEALQRIEMLIFKNYPDEPDFSFRQAHGIAKSALSQHTGDKA